jgi:2-C-methyl-D-erythritol 4-phosphate cytidylyltransferase
MKKVCAIILAAGRGKRMGAKVNKQFLLLDAKPILYYTLNAFNSNENIDEIVLVAAESEIDICRREIVEKYKFNKVRSIVAGGEERQHSVLNGLKALDCCDVVLIHDGARPFVSPKIISEGIEYSRLYGACACGVKPIDTIKVIDNKGFSSNTLKREELFAVQTPQCFKYDIIRKCHEEIDKLGILVTDDTMVAEMFNNKIYLYEGDYSNIKITTAQDLSIGEEILKKVFTNIINTV